MSKFTSSVTYSSPISDADGTVIGTINGTNTDPNSGTVSSVLSTGAYYITLRQELFSPTPTLAATSTLIDEVVGIDACAPTEAQQTTEDSAITSAEAPTTDSDSDAADNTVDSSPTTAQSLEVAFNNFLGKAGNECASGDSVAYLLVYRSDPSIPYTLEVSDGSLGAASQGTKVVSETISVSNASSIDLNTPATGSVNVTLAGEIITSDESATRPLTAEASEDGNSIQLSEDVTTSATVDYITEYDRVEIKLPLDELTNKYKSVVVTAYYKDKVATATIVPQDIGGISDLCSAISTTAGDDAEDCYVKLIRKQYCQCGGSYQGDETSYIPGSCGSPDVTVKEYVGCPLESTVLSDPDYYKTVCCEDPSVGLPLCRNWVQPNYGGEEIEYGQDYWREKYKGYEVSFLPIGPLNGQCGTTTEVQSVSRRNCCDDVSTIEPDHDYITDLVTPSSSGTITITGGRAPYTWRILSNGARFGNNQRTLVSNSQSVTFYTDSDACGVIMFKVTDGCSTATLSVRVDVGEWYEIPYDHGIAASFNGLMADSVSSAYPSSCGYPTTSNFYYKKDSGAYRLWELVGVNAGSSQARSTDDPYYYYKYFMSTPSTAGCGMSPEAACAAPRGGCVDSNQATENEAHDACVRATIDQGLESPNLKFYNLQETMSGWGFMLSTDSDPYYGTVVDYRAATSISCPECNTEGSWRAYSYTNYKLCPDQVGRLWKWGC